MSDIGITSMSDRQPRVVKSKVPFLAVLLPILSPASPAIAQEREPVVVTCQFEGQPLMILTYRGGMSAIDNTLQVGDMPPVRLAVGSSLSSAVVGGVDYTFGLRSSSANVTIGTTTFHGACESTLARAVPAPPPPFVPDPELQPFGLVPGTPIAALDIIEVVNPNTYAVSVTRKHPEFDLYAVEATPDTGVCRIVGLGRPNENDRYGDLVQSAFDRLLIQLAQYGRTRITDTFRANGLWDDPDEWVMAIRQNERFLEAVWTGEYDPLPSGLSEILLRVVATSVDTASLVIRYTFFQLPRLRSRDEPRWSGGSLSLRSMECASRMGGCPFLYGIGVRLC